VTKWTATFRLGELDSPRRFDAGGPAVLVSLIDGVPYAVEDSCLHRGASLASGVCRGGIITCPSHWWRYDLRDGALQGSPGQHLATFACRIVGDVVEVDLPEPVVAPSLREQLLAHARSGRSPDA